VRKSFGGHVVLDKVSLAVERGAFECRQVVWPH